MDWQAASKNLNQNGQVTLFLQETNWDYGIQVASKSKILKQ